MRADLCSEPGGIDDHPPHPGRVQRLQLPVQQRQPLHLEQGFGGGVAQGAHAFAAARSQEHGGNLPGHGVAVCAAVSFTVPVGEVGGQRQSLHGAHCSAWTLPVAAHARPLFLRTENRACTNWMHTVAPNLCAARDSCKHRRQRTVSVPSGSCPVGPLLHSAAAAPSRHENCSLFQFFQQALLSASTLPRRTRWQPRPSQTS